VFKRVMRQMTLGAGLRVEGVELRVQGSVFRVLVLGFEV